MPDDRPIDPWDALAAARLRYERAITHHEVTAAGQRDGRATPAALAAAGVLRAEAAAAFRAAAAEVGERTRVGLLCLASSDPAALAGVWGRLGLPAGVAKLHDDLAAARDELDRLRERVGRELMTYRQKVEAAGWRLDRVAAAEVDGRPADGSVAALRADVDELARAVAALEARRAGVAA